MLEDDSPTIDTTHPKDKIELKSPRNLVEVVRKKYDVLNAAPDERDDIISAATQYQTGVRAAFFESRDMTSGLSRQSNELESIARELKKKQ